MNTLHEEGVDERTGIPYAVVNNVKQPLYNLVEDGNGMQHKIANPLHPSNCPVTGIKEVEIIDKKKRHDPDITISRVDDPITGIIYGTVIGIDQATKYLVFKPIRLKVHQEYDMTKESDKQIWMVASRHSIMMNSPYPSSHKPYYKVIDRENEAEQKIINVKLRTRALQIIEAMKDGELVDMAINLGVDSSYSSQATLKAELMNRAERNAKEFCNIYDNVNRFAVTIFNRCRSVALITNDPNQGYLWKLTRPLGLTEAAAIRHINENAALMQTMDMESKQKSENFKKFATTEEKQTAIAKSEGAKTTNSNPSEFLTSEQVKDIGKKMEETLARMEEKEKALDEKLAILNNSSPVLKPEDTVKSTVNNVERPIEDYRAKATELKIAFTDETTKEELARAIRDVKMKEKGKDKSKA